MGRSDENSEKFVQVLHKHIYHGLMLEVISEQR